MVRGWWVVGFFGVVLSACASGPEGEGSEVAVEAEEALRAKNAVLARDLLLAKEVRTPEEEVLLGDALRRLGERERAAEAYYAARTAARDSIDIEFRALLGLGELALDRREPLVALSRFQDAERVVPSMLDRDRALVGQARARLKMGDGKTARQLRDQVLRSDIEEIAELDRGLMASSSSMASIGGSTASSLKASTLSARRPAGRGLPHPPILGRAEWRARPIRMSGDPVPLVKVERITIHHTAEKTLPGSSIEESAARIRAYQDTHQEKQRWADIGYHFVIDPQGRIWEGRALYYQGAHAGNPEANTHNVGVALVGNFSNAHPTEAQKKQLIELVAWLAAEYSVPQSRILGHDDVIKRHSPTKRTDCPGQHLTRYLKEVRKAIASRGTIASP